MTSQPIIAPLLANRWLVLSILALFATHLWLTSAGWAGWRCPIKSITGMPCPGCGLSSAAMLCLSGQWTAAMKTHLFAPLVLLMLGIAGIHACLPARLHRIWVNRWGKVEENAAVVPLVTAGMVALWLGRLLW